MPRHHPENSTKLVTLCESGDVGELALIKSLLDGNGIAYTVQHEHVGALYPGVALLGSRVMVEERRWISAADFTEMAIDVEVWDLAHLNRIIQGLKAKSVVGKVERAFE